MNGTRNRCDALATTRAAESGFVLPSAIFLLVVLAALGAYMVTLSRTSHISGALDVQGTRAYYAARAGIEWAAWQVVDPQGLQPSPTPCPTSPGTLVLDATLAGFTVIVDCVRTLEADGADTVAIYRITSTAHAGEVGGPDFVERQIQASFSK